MAAPALAGKLLGRGVGLGDLLAQGGEHLLVAREVSSREHDADVGVVAVEAAVGILCHYAGHAGFSIADEAIGAHAVDDRAARVGDRLALRGHRGVDVAAEARRGGVAAEVAHLVLPAFRGRPGLRHGHGVFRTHLKQGVERLSSIEGKVAHELGLGSERAVELPVVHEFGHDVGGDALVGLPFRVDVADGLAEHHEGLRVAALLVEGDDALAEFGGAACAGSAGMAEADHDDVGGQLFDELLGHRGGLAEPGGVLLEDRRNGFDRLCRRLVGLRRLVCMCIRRSHHCTGGSERRGGHERAAGEGRALCVHMGLPSVGDVRLRNGVPGVLRGAA